MSDASRLWTAEGDLIITPHVIRAEEALNRMVIRSAIAAFTGPTGAGKTYSMRRLLDRLKDIRVIWIESISNPTQRHLMTQILFELTGDEMGGTRYDLSRRLINQLKNLTLYGQVLLAVDEGQRLGSDCIEDLRYTHDKVGKGFSLAILGGPRCLRTIQADKMLASRIRRNIDFKYLAPADSLKMARMYHSIYDECSDEILMNINRACLGQFRFWDMFTDEAANICQGHNVDTVTPDIFEEAMKLINGSDWFFESEDDEEEPNNE